jgi:hypothetical protein
MARTRCGRMLTVWSSPSKRTRSRVAPRPVTCPRRPSRERNAPCEHRFRSAAPRHPPGHEYRRRPASGHTSAPAHSPLIYRATQRIGTGIDCWNRLATRNPTRWCTIRIRPAANRTLSREHPGRHQIAPHAGHTQLPPGQLLMLGHSHRQQVTTPRREHLPWVITYRPQRMRLPIRGRNHPPRRAVHPSHCPSMSNNSVTAALSRTSTQQ